MINIQILLKLHKNTLIKNMIQKKKSIIRIYTAFNTCIEFEDYLNTLTDYERTFCEVKENNKPQKLFADIDIKPAIDYGLLETVVRIFIDTIILFFQNIP